MMMNRMERDIPGQVKKALTYATRLLLFSMISVGAVAVLAAGVVLTFVFAILFIAVGAFLAL